VANQWTFIVHEFFLSRNFCGLGFHPNIDKEKILYFRMRTIKQWGFASEWTEEIKIEANEKIIKSIA